MPPTRPSPTIFATLLVSIWLCVQTYQHSIACAVNFPLGVGAYPSPGRQPRQESSVENMVILESEERHCLIVPKEPYTDVGESEQPGGTTAYCTALARSSDLQGILPADFWTGIEFVQDTGINGGRYAQRCIDPGTLDRLNDEDEGGQYDSTGGKQRTGNPPGSVCRGYNHYIELLEPSASRACLKCCEDEIDCPLGMDTQGCLAVIPGEYFDCE